MTQHQSSDDLAIPGFLRREQTNPQCSKCSSRAEFGYKIKGEMQWFCAEHRLSQNYADARLPGADTNPPSKQTTETLAQHAEEIRASIKNSFEELAEVGRRLTEARKLVAHGDWLPWLDREFQWSERTAQRLITIHQMKLRHGVSDLALPFRTLALLAAPSTPEPVREEVIERVESGEKISHEQVKEAVAEAKPKPARRRHYQEPKARPVIREDLIDQAMTIIKSMDHDTWTRFDKVYAKARPELDTIPF